MWAAYAWAAAAWASQPNPGSEEDPDGGAAYGGDFQVDGSLHGGDFQVDG